MSFVVLFLELYTAGILWPLFPAVINKHFSVHVGCCSYAQSDLLLNKSLM